jgi:hypothetical protein
MEFLQAALHEYEHGGNLRRSYQLTKHGAPQADEARFEVVLANGAARCSREVV